METAIIDSWKKAAEDLEIEIQYPFAVMVGEDSVFSILIKNFGSAKGTFILSSSAKYDLKEFNGLGYYISELNPQVYSLYNRKLFIDTLNDWGYYGDKEKMPAWYSGQGWT